MNIKKTIISLVPISLGLGSLIGCNFNFGHVEFTMKTVKLYSGKLTSYDPVNLYFSDSYKQIPFIELNDSFELLKTINNQDKNYKLTKNVDGSSYIFTRENGSTLTFDFSNNVIKSNNLNKFKNASYCVTSLDSRGFDDSFYDESGEKIKDQVRLNTVSLSSETYCEPTYVPLNNYNIKMYKQNDKYYLPFTTFYNIAGNPAGDILFNGENLFVVGQQLDPQSDYGKEFYSFPKQARSQALKEYSYIELCRDLDFNYGLSSEHGITTNFDTFLTNNGLKTLLLSDNKVDEYLAYCELQYHYLADSHSGFGIFNPYYGTLTAEETKELNERLTYDPAFIQHQQKTSITTKNRNYYKNIANDGSVIKPVFQQDDTLFITFDKFNYNSTDGIDWYYNTFHDMTATEKLNYIEQNKNDTLAIISYANDLVQADSKLENPTIKNVVLDLSGNGGGAADTAIFTLGWLGSAYMQLVDPISNYQGSLKYSSDINFDKKIDENDVIVSNNPSSVPKFQANGGKVYCITSDTSFSCGNYVPAMLKQSGTAKLIGTKSGGGACIVHVTGTADASGICFSGNKKLCIVRNGSYYSIDEGIEPDYYLDDAKILYEGDGASTETYSNRSKFVSYIKSFEDAKEATIDSTNLDGDSRFTNYKHSPSGKIIKGGNDFTLTATNNSGNAIDLTIRLTDENGNIVYGSVDTGSVADGAQYSVTIYNSDIDWNKLSDKIVFITAVEK